MASSHGPPTRGSVRPLLSTGAALSILCAAASALAGCAEEVSSDRVATRDLTIRLTGADEGSGVKASIELFGEHESARLTGTDALQLTAGDTVRKAREIAERYSATYVAELGSVSGDLVVDFVRRQGRSIHRVATIPPPFSLTVQGPSATEPLSITWDAASDDYTNVLQIEGDCIYSIYRALAKDTGSYQVLLAELHPSSPSAPEACPLEVKLTREWSIDDRQTPPPEDGSFIASITQRRTFAVDWRP